MVSARHFLSACCTTFLFSILALSVVGVANAEVAPPPPPPTITPPTPTPTPNQGHTGSVSNIQIQDNGGPFFFIGHPSSPGDTIEVSYEWAYPRQGYVIQLQDNVAGTGWQTVGSETITNQPSDASNENGQDQVSFFLPTTAVTANYRAVLISPAGAVVETSTGEELFVYPYSLKKIKFIKGRNGTNWPVRETGTIDSGKYVGEPTFLYLYVYPYCFTHLGHGHRIASPACFKQARAAKIRVVARGRTYSLPNNAGAGFKLKYQPSQQEFKNGWYAFTCVADPPQYGTSKPCPTKPFSDSAGANMTPPYSVPLGG